MPKYLRHTLFWLTIYLVWTYIRGNQNSYIMYFQVNLVQVGIYMAAYYSLRHIFIPNLLNKGKTIRFALGILIFSIVLYLFWRVNGYFWLDELRGLRYTRLLWMKGYLMQTVQVYAPAMILLTWESYNDRQLEIERIHQLEKEKLGNELKFLKAQINPHFLFNTLNNLYSNVINKSPRAPDMVMQLSGILDYVMHKSQNKRVPLSEEVKTIDNFLALEKIRYGERLEVEYSTGKHLSVPVSPLILLSLIENAFKHGASGDIDNPKIRIDIHVDDNDIICNVWNTKSKYTGEINDAYKEGIGLKNIQRQLDLIYPNKHELVIEDEADYFNVNLTIQSEEG